jgi:hypothetical protein
LSESILDFLLINCSSHFLRSKNTSQETAKTTTTSNKRKEELQTTTQTENRPQGKSDERQNHQQKLTAENRE